MNRDILTHLLFGLLAVSSIVLADPTPPETAANPSTTPTADSEYIKNTGFARALCPRPEQLQRDENMIWSGPNGWKAFNQSFASEIGGFVGAQWLGINVGKVLCVYVGKGKATFPITLERNVIIPSPMGGAWGPDEGGHKNCRSSQVVDCPFLVEKPKDTSDVYKDLDFFKANPAE